MTVDRWQLTLDRTQAIAAEARAVMTSGWPLSPGWLEEAVAWLGESVPSWQELTGSDPDERSYRSVIATPELEAWLICWPRDVHLQLHDHGGASGAFQVVDGALDERSLVALGGLGGAGALLQDRLVEVGEVVSFDGSYIHDVRNTRHEAATSIHVYSAAAREMTFYDIDAGGVRSVGTAASSSPALHDHVLAGDRPPVSA